MTVATWILAVMLAAAPPGRSTFARENEEQGRERYALIAEAIADVAAREAPLFGGTHGRERTAVLLAAVAFAESGYRRDVEAGETRGDKGRACGLWQIQATPVPCPQFVTDRRESARYALELMRRSFTACRTLPIEERLAAYASGRCDAGLRESRVRIELAQRWYARHPPGRTP